MQPPVPASRPHRLENHGHVREDEYFWLNQRTDQEVLDHLRAENRYTDHALGHTKGLQDRLFEEIKNRIKQDDSTVPVRMDENWYYTRFENGKAYPIHCRRPGTLEAPEQILLNVNELAEGFDYTEVGAQVISSRHDLLAYAIDHSGRRIYTIQLKDVESGEILADTIEGTTGNMTWAQDNRTLFYSKQDAVTLRSHQIWRHEVGTDPSRDVLVYEEGDETYNCYVWKSKSKRYLYIGSFHTLRSEIRYMPANDPSAEFRVFHPRSGEHKYQVAHLGEWFYIRSNDAAVNYRLMRTPVDDIRRERWEEFVPHRPDVLLSDFELFRDHLVLAERFDGLRRLRVRAWEDGAEHLLDFGEAAYDADLGENPEIDTSVLRYHYSSMTTPHSVYDYDMRSKEKTLLKRDEVLGEFETSDYETERLHATARDGVSVPISLVYRRDRLRSGGNPLLLYGYGSYGIVFDPSFSAARISLLDRGFVFAIAHVRGGSDLGRTWYEAGKKRSKWNTFQDFVDCAKHLLEKGWTSSEHLYAQGGSAGGLLMGVVVNEHPELFHGVIAEVPFVDVVTTMLDTSIPLTTGEYDEWGDPNRPQDYHYILSYSPYDNLRAQDYPHLLVRSGLHDSQVQYWEPTKWVARLRARRTNRNRLLLQTNMDAGHGGASGRYERYREVALNYAFLLDLEGIGD